MSRISEISNLGLSLTMIGGSRDWTQLGIVSGTVGFNIEMWKTGCTARRLSRSHRVMEWEPGQAMISYGPRNFLESLLEGRVVQKNCALTNV